jgi:hypothetical protein
MKRRRSRDHSHRHIPNAGSLDELGLRIDAGTARGAAPTSEAASSLDALGRRIDAERGGRRTRRRRSWRARRIVIGGVVAISMSVAAVAGASWYYAYQKYKAAQNPNFCGVVHKVCTPEVPGKPFNVLVIGSDSRAGLSGTVAAQTGAGSRQSAALIQYDDTFGFNELIGLGLKFHSFNPANLNAFTLPTYGAVNPSIGDVLYVDQPAAQQLLVRVFGQVGTVGGLTEPTNPPPTQYLTTPLPPSVATPTVPRHATSTTVHVTTTTAPLHTEPWYTFSPTACAPK